MEINQIRMAMTRWQETVIDSDLKKYYRVYKIKEDLDGHRVAVCGKGFFCLAFRMIPESGGYSEEKCLRIWHKDGNLLNLRLQERSQLVSQELSRIHGLLPRHEHRYFIDYDYRERAINVNGSVLPGIIMPWINGRPLDKYIQEHRDKTSLLNLANEFMTMFKTLRKYGIAHGDLSNTNILITPEGKIKLIDYDSVYVPTMKQFSGKNAFYQITGGQAPFQHPERLAKDYLMSAEDDNFSQHVIYLSLLAMAYKPELVDIISDKELLFTSNDLETRGAFTKTDIYKRIDSIDNPEVEFWLAEMANALRGSLSQVRSIVDLTPPEIIKPSLPHLVEYCTNCGHKFNNDEDLYCTQCGAQRLRYQEARGTYKVRLINSGQAKLQVIKVVKEYLKTDLRAAKDLVDSAPRIIASGLTKQDAREFVNALEEADAEAILM